MTPSTPKNATSGKSRMTYEKLMDSNFIKFPNHSNVVHNLFNPFVVALISFIATGLYTLLMDGDWGFTIIVAMVCAAYMQMKIAFVTMNIHGHGVGIIKKGKFSLLGLPTVVTIMLLIIFTIILLLNIIAYGADTNLDFGRVQIFASSMMFGFIMSMLSWRFHSYYETWYGSEYDARMELTQKGYSGEEIEQQIAALKKKGILF